jgi:hypothetical protein
MRTNLGIQIVFQLVKYMQEACASAIKVPKCGSTEKAHAKSDNITDGLTLSTHCASYLLLEAFSCIRGSCLYLLEPRLPNTRTLRLLS